MNEEIDRLRAEVERLRREYSETAHQALRERDEARAEAGAYREEIDNLRALLWEALRHLGTMEAVRSSPSDAQGHVDLIRRINLAVAGSTRR